MQRDVRGILSKLPKTLDETYERVLRDIHEDNREHARRLLHCLAVAVRPLRVQELAEILTFDFDAAEGGIPEHHADWRWKDQEEAVLSACSSLITVVETSYVTAYVFGKERVVQFSHFSVKEFLMSSRLAIPTRDVSRYHILPRPAHIILAQACLGFLHHLHAPIDPPSVEGFPLAEYAAKHWVAHAQFQDVASHVKCGMKDLFDPDKPHFALWVGFYNMDEPSGGFYERRMEFIFEPDMMDKPSGGSDERTRPTPLYYSALCGFHDITVDLAVKYPRHVNAIGGQYDTPLAAALSRSHIRVAELLLEHGADLEVYGTGGRTPLHTLLLRVDHDNVDSHIAGVRLLLNRSVDVNARDEGYRTPLHIAASRSKLTWDPTPYSDYTLGFVHLLVEHGADVNARDNVHCTPLLLAIKHSSPKIARFLLEHGADPHLVYEEGKTLLHLLLVLWGSSWGSIWSKDDLVFAQLLLEHGADVNARDNVHNTPLLLAMRHNSPDIARLLLEHGANPHSVYDEGKTLLHLLSGPLDSSPEPVVREHLLLAQLLLEHGADVNARDNVHRTPLLGAILQRLPNLARLLLEHGADSNLVYKEEKTLLHLLLALPDSGWGSIWSEDHLFFAQLLLEHGADVNARDNVHNTPLLLAVRYRSPDIVRLLLEHGADPRSVDNQGKTLLHLLSGSIGSGWVSDWHDNHLALAQLLLEHGADVNVRDNAHRTPLLVAVQHISPDITRLLLEHGADSNLVYEEGKTLLHLLFGPRDFNWGLVLRIDDHYDDSILVLAKLLLEHGADVNAQDNVHKTPLLLALQRDALDIAKFLLEHGADPNTGNSEGNTPLHTLLLERDNDNNNNVLILQLLLKHGADTCTRNKDHATPLDLAPYSGKILIAKVLLDHANGLEGKYSQQHCCSVTHCLNDRNVGANAQDKDHGAQLRLACYCGRLNIVQELLNHGANPKLENFQGENPLHLLSQGEYDSQEDGEEDGVCIAQELLAHGVDVNAQSKCHRTPLHLASDLGKFAIARVLLEHGAKPNVKDDHGETPLHLLARGKYYPEDDGVSVARLLIEWGADVNARDVEHRTPLHHASYNGMVAIARVLLEHGGIPNAVDSNGETPLHLASQGKDDSDERSISIMRLLLEHGAEIDAQNNYHQTPLALSTRLRKPKIANILREHSAYIFCTWVR